MVEKETRVTDNELSGIVRIEQHPDVWDAYNKLGQVAGEAGPLDEKTERLIKLAIAVGGGWEGAVRSNTRRGIASGLSPQEVRHPATIAVRPLRGLCVSLLRGVAVLERIVTVFPSRERFVTTC